MISHRYRCIYVKVPKCAGTTVPDWFSMHGKGHRIVKPWWYGGLLCEWVQAVARVMNLYPDYATLTGRNCRITLLSDYASLIRPTQT